MTALSWKNSDPPVIGANSMAQCMDLEKITYFIKNKMDVYKEICCLITSSVQIPLLVPKGQFSFTANPSIIVKILYINTQ